MKLNTEKKLVETEGFDSKPTGFNIKQSARAFEILSSNIYSDKILAVVREYGTNALDAHISAGKADVPFDVHLPNNFEPWYSIRDYGPGLSDEDVVNLYTTYFHSTKDSDNDVTGCLGLGSKSGFAYSDQFTITSRHEGVKRTYTAYVGENGAPEITKMMEVETDEESGLEIYMSVATDDFSKFHSRAERIFSRFEVKPNVVGGTLNYSKQEVLIEGSFYKVIAKEASYSSRHPSMAVQGVLAYPLNYKSLGYDTEIGLSWAEKRLYQGLIESGGIEIQFPMGDLNITASREELNYDKTTVANIRAKIEEVIEDLPKKFQSEIDVCKTMWEAKAKINTLTFSANLSSYVQQLITNGLKYKGDLLPLNGLQLNLKDKTAGAPVLNPLTGKMDPTTTLTPFAVVTKYTRDSLLKQNPKGVVLASSVEPSNTVEVIYMDVKFKTKHQVFFHNYDGSGNVKELLVIETDASRLPEVLEQMGNPPYILASTLELPPPKPKVPKVKGTTGPVAHIKDLQQVDYVSSWGGINVKAPALDETTITGGLYIATYDRRVIDPSSYAKQGSDIQTNDRGATRFFKECSDHGLIDFNTIPVYVVNASQKSKALNSPTWERLDLMLKDKIVNAVFKNPDRNLMIDKAEWMINEVGSLVELYPYKDNLKKTSPMFKLLTETQKLHGELIQIKNELSPQYVMGNHPLQSVRGIKTLKYTTEKFFNDVGTLNLHKKNHDVEVNKFKQLVSTVQTTYPLLTLLVNDQGIKSKSNVKDLVNYIEMCDKQRKKGTK